MFTALPRVAMNPRTECFCQSSAVIGSSRDAPFLREIRARTISFLLPTLVAVAAFFIALAGATAAGAASFCCLSENPSGANSPAGELFHRRDPRQVVPDRDQPPKLSVPMSSGKVFCGIEEACASLAGGLPGGVNRDVLLSESMVKAVRAGGGLFSSRSKPAMNHSLSIANRQVNSSAFSRLRVENALALRRPCERGMSSRRQTPRRGEYP